MFKNNRKEKFSLRKYKDGRTDSKLIGAVLIVGLGLLASSGTALADVSSNETDSATVVTDTSKVSSSSATTFTDTKDASKNVTVDAVLGKGVAEPTKANYNTGDVDGNDAVNFKTEATVNYKLESDKSLLKTETVEGEKGTVTTPYDKKGLVYDTDGKDYRESTVAKTGNAITEATGKKDTVEANNKVYEYVRSEVEGVDKATYDKTSFNNMEARVSPEGMHNKLGEIDYTKTTGKVYLVEETSDGHYGKFVLAENGVTSDEDAVIKWKEGQANAKDFTKENVTLQENDTILVMDRDTYAMVESSKQTTTTKKGEETYFREQIMPFTLDGTATGERKKVTTGILSRMNDSNPKRYRKPGEDGKFGTPDDIVYEDVYKIGEEDVYRTYLILGTERSGVRMGKPGYYGSSVITDFSLPEDYPPRDSFGNIDTSDNVFGRYVAPAPKPSNMFEALKGYAGRVYYAFDFLEKSIEEKAKVLNTEEDKKKTEEDKAKVTAARKRLDTYLEAFSKQIKDENLDVGILESNDQHNGELVFNWVLTYREVDARGNPLKYESLYKFTRFLNGLLKIPQAVGEFSIEGKGPNGGMDPSKTYDPNTKVYSEFEYITTGYTFTPLIDKKEMKETEDDFNLIEELYKKQKAGTISKEELKFLDKEVSKFVFSFKPKEEGLAKINSRGRLEMRDYKILKDFDLTEVKIDEKSTKTEEKEVEKLLTKGTLTILPDGKIKVENEETKDTPEYTVENTENKYFINSKITTKKIIRNRIETVDETTYTKKEIITPIRAYKVMGEEKPVVTHYYNLKITKEEVGTEIVYKKGSVNIKYVTTDGKRLKSETDKDNVTLETKTIVSLYSGETKVEERTDVKTVEQNYDTTTKQYPTLVDADTGFTYEYVGLKQGSTASGKVVEGTTEVVYEYRLVSEEEKIPSKSELTKTGSVDVKYVVINEDGTLKTLKSEIIKDKVPVEYEDTYVTYSNGVKVSERKEKRTVTEKYNTTDKQYPTLKDEATGLVYKYVGVTSDSAPVEGDVTAGEKYIVYSYVLDKKEDTKSKATEAEDKKGTVIVKFVDINGNSIADDKVVKNNVIVEKVTTTVSGGKEETIYKATGEEYAVTPPQTIEVDGLTFKLKKIVPVSEKWHNSTVEKGLVKEGVTTIVYQYVLQLMKAPEVEMLEYTGGAVIIDPPTVEIPEYEGAAVAIDPPVVEIPELKILEEPTPISQPGFKLEMEPESKSTPKEPGRVVEPIEQVGQTQIKRLANTGEKTTGATNVGTGTLIAGILLAVKRRQRENNLN